MHQPVQRRAGERRDLALEQRAVGVGRRHAVLLEELVQLLRLLGAGDIVAVLDAARMPQAGVAQHAPEVAAGLGVERDVREPRGARNSRIVASSASRASAGIQL